MRANRTIGSWLAAGTSLLSVAAPAQQVLDRVDPTANARDRPTEVPRAVAPLVALEVEANTPPPAAEGGVMIGAVTFTGLARLSAADFAATIAPWLGTVATPSDLTRLTGAIAARARAGGYVFATASIAPQRLASGLLTITVDEGRIDAIRIDGVDQPAVRAALQPLITGGPVTLAEVERRILVAGDIDGVRVSGGRFVRERGQGVLVVTVARTGLSGRFAVRNDGTAPIGPIQATLAVSATGVLTTDDIFSLTLVGTPLESEELHYGRLRYARRINRNGTEVAVSGSLGATRPGGYLAPFRITGESWFAGLSLLHPLHRRRASSLWLDVALEVRDLDQDGAGRPARRDRLTVARLGLHGFKRAIGGRLRGGISVARGLDVFDATGAGDALASRRDADGTFTTFSGWADWTRDVARRLSLRVAIEGQFAADPLLVSEEIGLGGGSFLRAYDWSERSGDQGAMGSLELRYDISKPTTVFRDAQLYTFVDGGRVSNLRGGFGGGALASAGGGMRADVVKGLSASFEVAAPLTGARYDTGNSDPRIRVGVVKSF
ncbi:MAG: hypothetical protein JWN21_605 [Sphingomonas bacterium]|uniref:ShlB/FhaC/HecB family hemolysin secretion/activation protein n=1 Tax=Sphingomonas bacterium TaxID=1895847 RepID=UPI00262633B3|nr:ShlB/FhaC/HecB family hemolysin secretion/activation protein [Sphingomonas bacterium]MDB5695062.1 hypothetical protein [Sphingomonas bacterium]